MAVPLGTKCELVRDIPLPAECAVPLEFDRWGWAKAGCSLELMDSGSHFSSSGRAMIRVRVNEAKNPALSSALGSIHWIPVSATPWEAALSAPASSSPSSPAVCSNRICRAPPRAPALEILLLSLLGRHFTTTVSCTALQDSDGDSMTPFPIPQNISFLLRDFFVKRSAAEGPLLSAQLLSDSGKSVWIPLHATSVAPIIRSHASSFPLPKRISHVPFSERGIYCCATPEALSLRIFGAADCIYPVSIRSLAPESVVEIIHQGPRGTHRSNGLDLSLVRVVYSPPSASCISSSIHVNEQEQEEIYHVFDIGLICWVPRMDLMLIGAELASPSPSSAVSSDSGSLSHASALRVGLIPHVVGNCASSCSYPRIANSLTATAQRLQWNEISLSSGTDLLDISIDTEVTEKDLSKFKITPLIAGDKVQIISTDIRTVSLLSSSSSSFADESPRIASEIILVPVRISLSHDPFLADAPGLVNLSSLDFSSCADALLTLIPTPPAPVAAPSARSASVFAPPPAAPKARTAVVTQKCLVFGSEHGFSTLLSPIHTLKHGDSVEVLHSGLHFDNGCGAHLSSELDEIHALRNHDADAMQIKQRLHGRRIVRVRVPSSASSNSGSIVGWVRSSALSIHDSILSQPPDPCNALSQCISRIRPAHCTVFSDLLPRGLPIEVVRTTASPSALVSSSQARPGDKLLLVSIGEDNPDTLRAMRPDGSQEFILLVSHTSLSTVFSAHPLSFNSFGRFTKPFPGSSGSESAPSGLFQLVDCSHSLLTERIIRWRQAYPSASSSGRNLPLQWELLSRTSLESFVPMVGHSPLSCKAVACRAPEFTRDLHPLLHKELLVFPRTPALELDSVRGIVEVCTLPAWMRLELLNATPTIVANSETLEEQILIHVRVIGPSSHGRGFTMSAQQISCMERQLYVELKLTDYYARIFRADEIPSSRPPFRFLKIGVGEVSIGDWMPLANAAFYAITIQGSNKQATAVRIDIREQYKAAGLLPGSLVRVSATPMTAGGTPCGLPQMLEIRLRCPKSKRGIMEKLGGFRGGLFSRQNWKKRIFTVEDGIFSYYKDDSSEKEQKSIARIPLAGSNLASVTPSSSSSDRQHLMELVAVAGEARTLRVSFSTRQEMHEWASVLKDQIDWATESSFSSSLAAMKAQVAAEEAAESASPASSDVTPMMGSMALDSGNQQHSVAPSPRNSLVLSGSSASDRRASTALSKTPIVASFEPSNGLL